MPTVILVKKAEGVFDGLTEDDERKYAIFKKRLAALGDGCIVFSWKEPRSGPHLRRFFAIFDKLFQNQDRFGVKDHLRSWLLTRAGHCYFVPGMAEGSLIAVPKSISYDELDEVEFSEVEYNVVQFLRSDEARTYLWPHLSDDQSYDMVESLLE